MQVLPPLSGLLEKMVLPQSSGLKTHNFNALFQFKQFDLHPQAFKQLYHISSKPHGNHAIMATLTRMRYAKAKGLTEYSKPKQGTR